MNMGFEVGWRGQLEDVGVEGGHFWLDVIEEIRLLHVRSLHFDWNLLEHFGEEKLFL